MIAHGQKLKVTPDIRDEIKKLLANGSRVTELAKVYGFSRQLVTLVRKGKFDDRVEPYVRCSGCGGKVIIPCRLCNIRRTVGHEN